MNNYLPYVFGTVTLLSGSYLFLLSFDILKSKNTENEQSALSKYKTFFKVISILMILRGAYNLLNPDPNRYKIGQNTLSPTTELPAEPNAAVISNS